MLAALLELQRILEFFLRGLQVLLGDHGLRPLSSGAKQAEKQRQDGQASLHSGRFIVPSGERLPAGILCAITYVFHAIRAHWLRGPWRRPNMRLDGTPAGLV